MKTLILKHSCALFACIAGLCLQACDGLLKGEAEGTLDIRFVEMKSSALPDTNNFIISVSDSRGNVIYEGRYADSPEKIITGAGTYNISARSCIFDSPAFDTPQYGDDQTAVVNPGQSTTVALECRQINSGIRLMIDSSFKESHPDGALLLKSSEGPILYSYSERRIAYFNPGTIVLLMTEGGVDQTLFTRRLEAQQILSVSLSASGAKGESSGGIKVGLDTTRTWISDSYILGGQGGSEPSDAVGIREAKDMIGAKGIWVYGYIVGGDLSSSKCSFELPFTSRTNIAIAAKSNCIDKEACLSVQLSQGDIRDALNLVDTPENLGRQVFLKGDIVASYYGIPGIQNLREFMLK